PMYAHEDVVLAAVARSIAELKRCSFAGFYRAGQQYAGDVFFVPDDTLVADEAAELGIRSPNQLFGGVVARPFVKTKAITHRLINQRAARPEGWSASFAERVGDVVLPGYTAFSTRDANAAAVRLLARGSIRLKEPLGAGRFGQTHVTTLTELEAFLDVYPPDKLAGYGLVLEENLRDVTTLSIGHVALAGMSIAYCGTQRRTTDNDGRSIYGGSDLVCLRGGWEALDRLAAAAEVRLAITQAKTYDSAMSAYSGFMASRRNYDVGQGLDAQGMHRSGVFEASWRSGGASTAELAALAAFAEDPTLRIVEASA